MLPGVDGQSQEIDLLSYCLFALLAQLVGFQNLLLKSEVIVTTKEFQNSCTFSYRQMGEVVVGVVGAVLAIA